MSFLTVGGDGSQRPTFFELIAADRLMPTLKAAIVFSLSVNILRRTPLIFLRIHDSMQVHVMYLAAPLHTVLIQGLYGRYLHRGDLSCISCWIGKMSYSLLSRPSWTGSHWQARLLHLQTACMACGEPHM